MVDIMVKKTKAELESELRGLKAELDKKIGEKDALESEICDLGVEIGQVEDDISELEEG